jgi:ribonuclease HI
MIIYCDGSSDINGTIGWGIIAQQDGESKEITGAKNVGVQHHHMHEMFAFVEAVLHAHQCGLSPHEVSFYTDDQALVYGANYHNVTHWGPKFDIAPHLRGVLEAVGNFYPEGTVELVMKFFEFSHIVWVKGHSGNFMNMRVDHLAKRAMRKLSKKVIGAAKKVIVPFMQWLRDQVVMFMNEVVIPFAEVVIEAVCDHIVPKAVKEQEIKRKRLKILNVHVLNHLQNYHLQCIMEPDGV